MADVSFYAIVMVTAAIATFLLTTVDTYLMYLVAALGIGIAGGSFAVGIAYTSRWFPNEKQGTALGIFGLGNVGKKPLVLWVLGMCVKAKQRPSAQSLSHRAINFLNHNLGLSTSAKQILAIVAGGVFGGICAKGIYILIRRRLTDVRIRATSSRMDIFIHYPPLSGCS